MRFQSQDGTCVSKDLYRKLDIKQGNVTGVGIDITPTACIVRGNEAQLAWAGGWQVGPPPAKDARTSRGSVREGAGLPVARLGHANVVAAAGKPTTEKAAGETPHRPCTAPREVRWTETQLPTCQLCLTPPFQRYRS